MRTDWIEYIPMRIRVAAVPAVLAVLCALAAALGPGLYAELVGPHTGLVHAIRDQGVEGLIGATAWAFWIAAAALAAGAAAATIRRGWALRTTRRTFLVAYGVALFYVYVVLRVTGLTATYEVRIDGFVPDVMDQFVWRWRLCWPAVIGVAALAVTHVASLRRRVVGFYERREIPEPRTGDRIVENVRTHGRDPRHRKSMLSSFGTHVFVILVLPWLLDLVGCVENYMVPFGSGTPAVMMVQVVQPKPKKKKKLILRPNSAIYFNVPDLDESEILKQVEELTELTYTADPNAVAGKIGTGGGKQGGWPEGMEKGRVRFIRLEYNSPGWKDGHPEADRFFLAEFKKLTGLPTAVRGEYHPIRLLAKYDKGFAPPFVYMTGEGHIRVSGSDINVLRQYLAEGGMIFADAGSAHWNREFRSFLRTLLPGEPLLTISDDDPIFQMPYAFPNGAPPLWHHGGYDALGVKVKGRWVVFYHPGDLNDTWKPGHSGMDRRLARQAVQVGINIVYYAFTHYLEETRKYRK